MRLVKESLFEKKKLDELPNDELKQKHQEDPSSEEGILSKNELERRKDVNGELDESGGYPEGAANDSRAPWNDNTKTNKSTTVGKKNYEIVSQLESDNIIFKDVNGDHWLFYTGDVDKKELAEYSDDIPLIDEEDEDGPYTRMDDEYLEDWEPDMATIEKAINDWANRGVLVMGGGMDDWESGASFVKIDMNMSQELNIGI